MSDDRRKSEQQEKKNEKNKKQVQQASETTQEVGSMTSRRSQFNRSTQTKSHGTGPVASATRSTPSFVNRTLTVIQDDPGLESGNAAAAVENTPRDSRSVRHNVESVKQNPLRSQQTRSTQTSISAPVAPRSVHQVTCARSMTTSQMCRGSMHRSALQRGCCAEDVQEVEGGVVMGCCVNENQRAASPPTAYHCHKARDFPDSVYPTSSGLFCCHGTWREEGEGGPAGVRSFVGMCCTHALPRRDIDNVSVREMTTAVVELETDDKEEQNDEKEKQDGKKP